MNDIEPLAAATADFTPEQAALWGKVELLWQYAVDQQMMPVEDAIHPDYMGWVTGEDHLQDRNAAIRSVGPESPAILAFQLVPAGVRIFYETTGIVCYRYQAEVSDSNGDKMTVKGRWSEVYSKESGVWELLSVTGGPDGMR